jgi:CRP/FNR family transcriptional regulator
MLKFKSASLCEDCYAYNACLASKCSTHEHRDFGQTVKFQRKIKRGDTVATERKNDSHIHLIKSGSFKISVLTREGFEQITGFKQGGDVIGLERLFKEKYWSDSIALKDSIVCSVSIHDIKKKDGQFELIHNQLFNILQNEITDLYRLITMINQMDSVSRVANFILMLSEKNRIHGFSPYQLQLDMTRTDIGSFLGLNIETVSRKLTELSNGGSIKIDRRMVEIKNINTLSSYQLTQ